jgi:hypothetical protein
MELIELLLSLSLEVLKLPFSLLSSFLVCPLVRRGQQNFPIHEALLFTKHSLCRCLCSSGACQDTNILQKKGVATGLGGDLELGDSKDLGNNVSTSHWLLHNYIKKMISYQHCCIITNVEYQ